jgi:hypothetical protein
LAKGRLASRWYAGQEQETLCGRPADGHASVSHSPPDATADGCSFKGCLLERGYGRLAQNGVMPTNFASLGQKKIADPVAFLTSGS